MTNWTLKIHAYLHDPPDKPLALGRGAGHAAWGSELAQLLTGRAPDPAWHEYISRADHLASGADRTGLLVRDTVALVELRHPLSGQPIDLTRFGPLRSPLGTTASGTLREEVERLHSAATDDEARFFAVWGILPDMLRRRQGPNELGSLWDWLPAETRMPNHAIRLHQGLVSALTSLLHSGDTPALLSFTIGPVQSFIAQARRTSDLMGGSAMLARSILEAIWVIAGELGPDHVVFPALHRNAAFWQLVRERFGARINVPDTLTGAGGLAAGLPNRFLAIVPASAAAALAGSAERAARGWWHERANRAGADLESRVPDLAGFAGMAHAQVDAFLQVAWAFTPWPPAASVSLGDEHCRVASWLHGGSLPPANEQFIRRTHEHRESQGKLKPFVPNGGTLYGAAFETVEATIAAVKRSRPIPARVEDGLKCTMCGERQVVPDPSSFAFHEQRELWRSAVRNLPAGSLRRGESLCGVCWTKRHFALENDRFPVPSTAEIATTPFKQAVLDHLDELTPEAEAVVEAANEYQSGNGTWVVSSVARAHSNRPFTRVPGELLLPALRDAREAPDDAGDVRREVIGRIAGAARALRTAATRLQGAHLPLPRPYLAALVLDGDEMGKWLSGARNGPLRRYLSRAAAGSIDDAGGRADLDSTWPVTPALHATLSEACDIFSQHTVPRTLHADDLPGVLVYSGGDDVLAFTPIGCPDETRPIELATEAALRLRFRFSGHVRREGSADVVDPASSAGFVVNRDAGLNLAFGDSATASAALAVFHQKWPLGRALAEVRIAEEYAKETLGRDALAVVILRRSGQVTKTGLKFRSYDGDNSIPGPSPVVDLQRLAHAFAFDRLSPRFLSEVSRRLATLPGGLPPGQLLDLSFPLARQALDNHFHGASEEREALIAVLERLARASAGPPPQGATGGERQRAVPLPDRAHLDRWIALIETAAFLGRGGDL